jgi:hypothetical protein
MFDGHYSILIIIRWSCNPVSKSLDFLKAKFSNWQKMRHLAHEWSVVYGTVSPQYDSFSRMVNCSLKILRTSPNQYQHNLTAITHIYIISRPLAPMRVITVWHLVWYILYFYIQIYFIHFNISMFCILCSLRWPHGWPHHAGVYCKYKLIIAHICTFAGNIMYDTAGWKF